VACVSLFFLLFALVAPFPFGDTLLLMLHECCKSKVGESHEGSSCPPEIPATADSRCLPAPLLLRLFDWQAERITLAIIALVPHEQRKRQRRHIMLPGPIPQTFHIPKLFVSLHPLLSFVPLIFLCAIQLVALRKQSKND